MKISIVSTLYHSSLYIKEFCERVIKSIPAEFNEFEIILVDDGSPDDSLSKAIELKKSIPEIKILELSRNFGHHKAIIAGIENSSGDYIFLIDIDLEEKPELLTEFWFEMKKDKNIDVVAGYQNKRRGGFLEKLTGKIFYTLFNFLSDSVKSDFNFCTVRLMNKNYVSSLIKFKTQDFYFAPVCYLVGFEQKKIQIKKTSSSPSTYSLLMKYHLLINSIFAYSLKPLYMIFYLGSIISITSLFLILFLIINKMIYGVAVDGWTSLIVTLVFSFGLIISSLGTIAIYLSKIFRETRNEPFVLIKKTH